MSDHQNQNSTGEQIKGALTEALQSGDFRRLNSLVSQTVTNTLKEVGIHISPGSGQKVQDGGNDVPPQYGQQDTGWQNSTQQTGAAPDPGGQTPGGEWRQYRQQTVWQNRDVSAQRNAPQAGPAQYGTQTQAPGSTATQQRGWQAQIHSQKEQLRQQLGWQLKRQQEQHARLRQERLQKQQISQQQQLQFRQQQLQQQQLRQAQLQQAQLRHAQLQQAGTADLSLIKMKKVGSVSSVLYQVFGGIGLGITGLVTFIRLIVLSSGETTLAGWIVNLIFLAFFFGMVRLGIGQKRRLRRAIRYVRLCDYKMYCEIEMIAKNTGKEDAYVARDIEKMLDDGFFPEGHLDGQKTCFMLNDVVFRQYLEAENSRRQREGKERTPERTDAQRAQGTEQNVKGQAVPEMSGTQEAEMNTMVSEGMECIRRLRDLNDRISSEDISKRLFRLENLLKDIFDSICEHPEQMHRMHKLMDYYLPTTLKLVEAYEEFDRVSTPGEEIASAKSEIENTLDTINQAFKELLGSLFQDAAFDATTDAQVLKTMLAKEGLTREMEYVTLGRDS